MTMLRPTKRQLRFVQLLAPLTAVSLLAAACGDDDDTADEATTDVTAAADTSTTKAEVDLTEYCSIVDEINNGDEAPTVELVERYVAAVPDEGKGDANLLLDALRANDGQFPAIMSDPEAVEAIEGLTTLEGEVCEGAGASTQDPSVQEIDESATRINLTLSEYTFVGDLPTTAGRHSFVFTNDGDEPHIAILLQLEEGATVDQVIAAQGQEGVAASFESAVAPPGAETVITTDLTAGDWILICPIPDAEGTSHAEHGMVTSFSVS